MTDLAAVLGSLPVPPAPLPEDRRPQDEARDKLTVAHCLSIACSNFEKHAYCLSAKGTSPPGSMFSLSPIILQIPKIERLNGAALITRSMRR